MSKVKEVPQEIAVQSDLFIALETSCRAIINGRVAHLSSPHNLNKYGNRKLIVLDDDNFSNTMQSVKSVLAPLPIEEQSSLFRDLQKHFITELRSNELIKEKASSKSQVRKGIDVQFDIMKSNCVELGLAFEHPTKQGVIVFEEMTLGSGAKKVEKAKLGYKGLSLNCNFDSFVDDVVEMEKIIKS